MSVIENAVNWAIAIANDDSHGYSQANRWGTDYDCSSLIIQAWENAGTGVKSKGATYTGNMKSVFTRCGFKNVINSINVANGSGLQYGDILLNERSHTAMYIGNGKIVHASSSETGGKYGKPGDQTGREICVRSYYNYPWDCVLRYTENVSEEHKQQAINPGEVDWGEICKFVIKCGQQAANDYLGEDYHIEVDGIVGPDTRRTAKRVLQKAMNDDYGAELELDGVIGRLSRDAGKGHYIKKGEVQYMVTCAEILSLLNCKNPNGVEYPGKFGNGLEAALGTNYLDFNGFVKLSEI